MYIILKTNVPLNLILYLILLYVCLPNCFYIDQPSICLPFINISFFISIHLSIYLCVYLYVYLYIYLFIFIQTSRTLIHRQHMSYGCMYVYLSNHLSVYLSNHLSIYLPTFIHNQQNSEPQTAHVIWLQEPSSILTMRTLHLGHTFTSSPPPFTPLSSLPDLDR